jgi:hypothetical protein
LAGSGRVGSRRVGSRRVALGQTQSSQESVLRARELGQQVAGPPAAQQAVSTGVPRVVSSGGTMKPTQLPPSKAEQVRPHRSASWTAASVHAECRFAPHISTRVLIMLTTPEVRGVARQELDSDRSRSNCRGRADIARPGVRNSAGFMVIEGSASTERGRHHDRTVDVKLHPAGPRGTIGRTTQYTDTIRPTVPRNDSPTYEVVAAQMSTGEGPGTTDTRRMTGQTTYVRYTGRHARSLKRNIWS